MRCQLVVTASACFLVAGRLLPPQLAARQCLPARLPACLPALVAAAPMRLPAACTCHRLRVCMHFHLPLLLLGADGGTPDRRLGRLLLPAAQRTGGRAGEELGGPPACKLLLPPPLPLLACRDCVRALRPKRLVPTVNADSPAKSRAIVDRFADLMDLSADRSRLDCYLLRRPGQPREVEEQEEGQEGEAAVEEVAVADACGEEEEDCSADPAGAPQQQAGAAAAAAAGPSAAAAASDVVNLSAIDVSEQQRILAQILASSASRGGTSSGGGGGKKRRPPGSGSGSGSGSGGGLKQGSLKRFFQSASPTGPPAPG